MTLSFSIELAHQLVESEDTFPVDLEDAVIWLGYSRKENALNTLKSYFEEGFDFYCCNRKSLTGGRPSHSYYLTVSCFKELGMLAKTSQGKQIRKYFLECERLAKQKTTNNTPQTYIEALKALVASEEAKEQLKLQNSILENQVESLTEDVERQAEIIDELFDYSSIVRIAKFNSVNEKNYNWRKLKATCEVLKLEILQAPDSKFGVRNLYPHEAWRTAYPDTKLPALNTLIKSK